jgi:hypothetical protein
VLARTFLFLELISESVLSVVTERVHLSVRVTVLRAQTVVLLVIVTFLASVSSIEEEE